MPLTNKSFFFFLLRLFADARTIPLCKIYLILTVVLLRHLVRPGAVTIHPLLLSNAHCPGQSSPDVTSLSMFATVLRRQVYLGSILSLVLRASSQCLPSCWLLALSEYGYTIPSSFGLCIWYLLLNVTCPFTIYSRTFSVYSPCFCSIQTFCSGLANNHGLLHVSQKVGT